MAAVTSRENTLQTIPELHRVLGRVSDLNQSINWHHHMKDNNKIRSLAKIFFIEKDYKLSAVDLQPSTD